MLADLNRGRVYVYFYHQFDQPLVLDVDEELKNPEKAGDLSSFFPKEVREEARKRYEAIQKKGKVCTNLAVGWIAIVILGLLLFLLLAPVQLRRSWLWLTALIILGPPAFLLWVLFVRRKTKGLWVYTSQEVIGDLLPVVISYFVVMCLVLLVPSIQSSWVSQLLVVFGVPILFGWLLFNAPLLFSRTGTSYGSFLGKRFPHVLITTFLGMAGIIIITMPGLNLAINTCRFLPPTVFSILVIWFIVGLGGFIAALLIFFFEKWTVKRGYLAWSSTIEKSLETKTQSWKQLWWCVIICLVVLFLGIFAGISINNILL
jgi:MFS family permease